LIEKKKIRVADYIAARCVEAGAKHVFLVTGGGAMHLNDAFGRNKELTPICFHHEQAAAIAAESYYRLTNHLAVLNVTTGPGGINALNGVFGAYVDSLGMIVVSGQVKRETFSGNYPLPLRQLGDQEVDIVKLVKPIVKYATVLNEPLKVREVMDKALFLTTFGRPGPVWVDVPVDVQGALIDPDDLKPFDVSETLMFLEDEGLSPNTKVELATLGNQDIDTAVEEILNKLLHSKRPVLFVGNGVRISGIYEEFLSLVQTLKIPVVTGWNAHDALTNENDYFSGRPGTLGDRAGNFTVQNADFILVLGCRLNIRQISYNWKEFANRSWKAMVDVDSTELDKPTLKIDLKVHANLAIFIPKIQQKLKNYVVPELHHGYLKWCKERVKKYPIVTELHRSKISRVNPYGFIDLLFSKLTSEDVVITGNGSACVIGFQAAKLRKGQRLYTNSGNASMGYDLPAAIGASIATGKTKRIICLAGDGSLMMNLQELQTLVGYGLPVKVIVLNNQGYHSIRQTQQAYFSDNMFGIGPEDGVSLPDFVSVANAFKIPATRVNTLADWESENTQNLFNSLEPALIEIVLDVNQMFSPKLASRKLDDGTMVSPSLEDMAPFLSREELMENIIHD
jgi:acetolactate synthase-1/2/3 large subunit